MKYLLALLLLVSGPLLHAQTQEQIKKLDSLFDKINANDLAMGSIQWKRDVLAQHWVSGRSEPNPGK